MEITDEHHTLVPLSPAIAPCTQYDLEQPGTTVYSENSIVILYYSAINFLKKWTLFTYFIFNFTTMHTTVRVTFEKNIQNNKKFLHF